MIFKFVGRILTPQKKKTPRLDINVFILILILAFLTKWGDLWYHYIIQKTKHLYIRCSEARSVGGFFAFIGSFSVKVKARERVGGVSDVEMLSVSRDIFAGTTSMTRERSGFCPLIIEQFM